MLNKLLSLISGGLPATTRVSDEDLLELLTRLKSPDPPRDLHQIRHGARSLVGTSLALLSNGEEVADAEFVRRAYQGVLGREPDEQGFRSYVGSLTSGTITRPEVVYSFLSSPEFQRLHARERVYVAPGCRRTGRLRAFAIDMTLRALYPDRVMPPLTMRNFVGGEPWDAYGEHFEVMGRHFVEKLTKDAGLGRDSRVLDVGSGCGRLAIPLTEVIGPSGCYVGLEAVISMVRWCQRKISPRFPQFSFIHGDIRNEAYNPKGKEKPQGYQFPLDDDQFDLVIATSLFTHLLPEATQNYIPECARVLEAGGRVFGTFFLVENGTRSSDGKLDFSHRLGSIALTANSACPESAVAYRTDWLLEVFRQSRLELLPPVRWGGWSGRQSAYSGQDVLILQKQQWIPVGKDPEDAGIPVSTNDVA